MNTKHYKKTDQWETLLKGLVKAVIARKILNNEEMANIIMEQISSHHDLHLLINGIGKCQRQRFRQAGN